MAGRLTLKWGDVKAWRGFCDDAVATLQDYSDSIGGIGMPAMGGPRLNDEQIGLLHAVIDAVDEPIVNDFTGWKMTNEEAKRYISEYHKR